LKPTYGRVPAYPASAFGTVAHLGPMTRRPADARAMLQAMSGADAQDWLQGPGRLAGIEARPRSLSGAKIAFWSTPACGSVAPEIASVLAKVMADLEKLGAEITPVSLPEGDWRGTFDTLWSCGAAARAAGLPAESRARLDPGLQDIIAAGEGVDAVGYIKAMSARAELGRAMEALAAGFDVILSPGCAVLPFPAGHEVPPDSGYSRWVDWAGFSFPINMTQQPAAVVPCGQANGLPVALQIVGPRGEDGRVLDFADALAAAFPAWFL
jgi:amidase/aspartyl-tRNA(Asn)/glutamyl-tRNA(Gln) amidotransferase subunit A